MLLSTEISKKNTVKYQRPIFVSFDEEKFTKKQIVSVVIGIIAAVLSKL